MLDNDQIIQLNKFYHCSGNALMGGGVKTYVDGLNKQLPSKFASSILSSVSSIDQSLFKLIHFHDGSVQQADGSCPIIFTAHNHEYCASGSKYFSTHQSCCDRPLAVVGCTWGHVVDGCGSRKPQNIIRNIQRAYGSMEILRKLHIPIITVSDYVRKQFILNGLPLEQVVTLHLGISEAPSSQPLTHTIHKQKRILFVGRIVPDKGLEWLIHAFAKVDSRIHLDIAGEGWGMVKAKDLAKNLKLQDRITWHGWCSGQRMESLYQNCFAVVFPSLWPEPAGLVTLEAYARYRPVIASNVGGIPEYIRHPSTGLLVNANNTTDLIRAIETLSDDYHLARQMGESGHLLFINEFTQNRHIHHLMQLYDVAIDIFHAREKGKAFSDWKVI
jgi:glycosyltransferase involved in cell wall biosynthesis